MLELERESILLVILEGNCMKEKVEAALALIRPQLQADGGNIELVDVSESQANRCLQRMPHGSDDTQGRGGTGNKGTGPRGR